MERDKPPRTAIVSGLKEGRRNTAKNLSALGGVLVVHDTHDTITNFKQMMRKSPQIIMIETGTPNNFHYELKPKAIENRVKRSGISAKVLLRTELDREHPFIQQALKQGFSIIDERFGYKEITEAIALMQKGLQVVLYKGDKDDLDTFRKRPKRTL